MSWKMALVVGWVLVLGIVFARLVEDPDTGTATWDAARASGFGGYLLLWASVMGGMLLHLRVRPLRAPLTWLLEGHRMVSTLGLSFVAAHMVALLLDPAVHFGIAHVAVPFTSSYRPIQTGLGTLAFWLMVMVLASTAMAARMSYGRWRKWHYLAFPAWALALLHGMTAGTDASAAISIGIYSATAAAVAALGAVRLAGRGWASAGEAIRPV